MENNQNTKPRLSKSADSKLTQSRRQDARLAGWNSLLELMKHRPVLVLSGVWVSLIASATIAGFSLTNTSHAKQTETTPIPVAAEKPAENYFQGVNPWYLWLLSAFCPYLCRWFSGNFKTSEPFIATSSTQTRPVFCTSAKKQHRTTTSTSQDRNP